MMEKFTVVKVGGAVVEDAQQLDTLLHAFCAIEGHKALVHGGGRRATKIAAALGIESKMVGGRRITDADMLEVVTMVYGGLINKSIVARLQALGTNSIGLTGADMDIIRSHRRPVKDGIDFGFVGDVDNVQGRQLAHLAAVGIVPILAPLTHDGTGTMLNTNADTIAAETALSLAESHAVTLMYCFEKPGVLSNPDDEASVIRKITRIDFNRLVAEGTVSGGMVPKIENALRAVEAGVERVVITRADLIGQEGCGTVITR